MSRWKPLALLSILTLGITTEVNADEAAWALLTSVEIVEEGDDANWRAVKTFPDPLRAAAEDFTITGYVVPVLAEPYIQTFMLVSDPADCPFCGSNGYGPVLEVHLKRPIGDLVEFTEMTVRGQRELIEDPETYQAFRLIEAYPMGGEG